MPRGSRFAALRQDRGGAPSDHLEGDSSFPGRQGCRPNQPGQKNDLLNRLSH